MAAPAFLPSNQNKTGDFTLICPDTELVETWANGCRPKDVKRKKGETKKGETIQADVHGIPARVQSCSCYGGRARSLTVRTDNDDQGHRLRDSTLDRDVLKWNGYQPKSHASRRYLISQATLCEAVFRALRLGLSDRLNQPGLVVVSGGTGSSKTILAMGMIQMRLRDLMNEWLNGKGQTRKPHLVTCEDNIESYFVELENLCWLEDVFETGNPQGFPSNTWLGRPDVPDYTPRKLLIDTESLREAVDDALRMKPAVFYGGEIRDGKDWKHLFRLAQSHFVVVTTHASSLITTFAMLQKHLQIRTSAQRSELATSVQAVVHMRPEKLAGNVCFEGKPMKESVKLVLPCCWFQTPASIAAYTSDGVASLVPEFTDLETISDGMEPFCIGRAAFARHFGKTATIRPENGAKSLQWDKAKAKAMQMSTDGKLILGKGKDLKAYTSEKDWDDWYVAPDFIDELTKLATVWDLAGE